MLLLPAFQTTLTVLTVGYELSGITVGIVNNELPEWNDVCFNATGGCKSGNMTNLSCRYTNALPKDILNLVNISFTPRKQPALNQ